MTKAERVAEATPLLPCPFCSQPPLSLRTVSAHDGAGPDWWQIACGDCEIKIERPTQEMALRDWQSRDNAQAKTIANLAQKVLDEAARIFPFSDASTLAAQKAIETRLRDLFTREGIELGE